ncbi:hypothetical protein NL676_029353 [Syzygium grande]|nr:hypothetical protein NL676_029353 [Syzygium grande]
MFLVPASGYFQPFQDCEPVPCGDQQISYPFRHKEQPSHCGYPGYELGCDGYNPTLSMASLEYRVIHMNMSAQILEVARMDLLKDMCPQTYVDTTLNFSLFNYTPRDLNSTLFYKCDPSMSYQPYQFYCHPSGGGYLALDVDPENQVHEPCNVSVLVPILKSEALGPSPALEGGDYGRSISEVLKEGFEITWIANTSQCENCNKSGGRCGYDWTRQEFNCFCPDGAYPTTCDGPLGMYAYSDHLICGFQLAKAVQSEGLLGIPFPLLVNWKTTRSCP